MGQKNNINLELVTVAKAILEGKINLIEGSRRISALRFFTQDPENDIFDVMRMVDSETDDFPLGEVRANMSKDYLRRKDIEAHEYLLERKQTILDACKKLIRAFS